MQAILIWLAKAALEYGFTLLARKLGFDRAKTHILGVLANAAPLQKTEQNGPTPSQERNPNVTNHPGGL